MKNLRRSARRHQAGVESEEYWDFQPGQRVMTPEGFPGKVAEVQDGPHPGAEQYVVELDNDMGGGEYGPSELRPLEDTTAAKTAAADCSASLDGQHALVTQDGYTFCNLCGYEPDTGTIPVNPTVPYSLAVKTATSDEARDWGNADREDMEGEEFLDPPYAEDLAQVNAGVNHVASEDYPELADILTERPPLPHSERIAALRKRAASIPSLPDWAILQQFTQYPQSGPEGLSYFRGDIDAERYVDCLLYRKDGNLVGVLNHYPMDMGPERKGNVLILVHPEHRKQGIGRALWEEAKQRWGVTVAGQDLTPEGKGFTDRVGHLASLQRQAGFWDRVLAPVADHMLQAQEESGHGSFSLENGSQASYDWCRFRRNSRCFYPHTLNQAATEKMGYAVWEPVDRGYCPRDKWEDQKACPAPSEPGPKSGERNWRYETWKRWEEGGQGGPAGQRWSSQHEAVSVDTSVQDAPTNRKQPPSTQADDPGRHMVEDLVQVIEERDKRRGGNPYSDSNPYTTAAAHPEFSWHVTAKWRDVQAKAKRIRSGGGVRVISASPAYLVGEVKGDTEVYQATLTRVPGTEKIAFWECGCAWAAYSWGRSGRWKKYEGRLCSHALALNYEGQSRGWGGQTVTEDTKAPAWRGKDVQTEYAKPPMKPWRVDAAQKVAYPAAPMPGGFETYEDAAAWILAQASSVEPKVTADVSLHGIQHNGEMVGLQYKLKTFDSLLRKLQDKIAGRGIKPQDLSEPFRHVKDALRYTIAFPEPGWGDWVQDTLYELQGLGYQITEEENTWAPGDAYSGLHYNFIVPNSEVTMELQFHTSASVALKEKVLHKMYEEFRLPSTPLARRQYLYDEMTKYWDAIPIPDNALDFPVEKFLMRPVAVSLDLAEAPATRIARDMLADGDDSIDVIAILAALGVADAPALVTEAMAAGPFQVKVRGLIADVLDFNDDGTVQVAGIGPVAPEVCEYPTFHPTRGLSLFGSLRPRTAAGDGYMVAIEPPRPMIEAIHAQMVEHFGEGVEAPTNYHVTLAYPGDAGDVDEVALEAAVRDWATRWGPMSGRLSGYGVFHQEGGEKVLYASVDIPGLDRARDDLVDTLSRFGIALPDDHGFTPHCTLMYGEGTPPEAMPAEAQEEFTVSEVALVLGTDWKHVSLETGWREDIGSGRDLAWGDLPFGTLDGGLAWAGEDVGSGVGAPETAASYVAAQQVEAELHEEPEPALPTTTGEDEDGEPDFVPGDPRLAHLMGDAPAKQQGGEDMNIAQAAKAHLAKTALKSFTPAEQKQIIEEGSAEGVVAANLDRLDLSGTHYIALEEALQAAEAEPDDENWLM